VWGGRDAACCVSTERSLVYLPIGETLKMIGWFHLTPSANSKQCECYSAIGQQTFNAVIVMMVVCIGGIIQKYSDVI
jgi:hypothetical protein